MEHLKSEKHVCLICLQFLNEELNDLSDISTLELRQNVFNKASKYLSSEVFYPCFQWNFIEERSSPICLNCFSSVEKVFKLHEMVENLEQKILELVDSFTSEVVQHHNRLKDVCNSGDDPYLDSNNLAGEKITEIVYEPDNDIDIKEDGGYNSEYELGTRVRPSGETADEDDESLDAENFDPIVNDVIANPENSAVHNTVISSNASKLDTTDLANSSCAAIQYPGLHLKQLRVTLTRLQLDLGANIRKNLENVTRPKRKAALAATASMEKIHHSERNIKKRKLSAKNDNDTDWEEDEIHSDTDLDSDCPVDNEILPRDKTNSDNNATNSTQRYKRPTIFEMAKRFKCQSEFCNMSFNFTKQLNSHSSESGHDNPKLYKCDRKNCSKDFFNKTSMKNHVKFHHKKNQFNCKPCRTIFTQKRALQIHQYNSHMEKMFKCDNCEQSFARKVNLTNHKKLHAGKHFECKLCPAIYLWNISLKMHTQIAHNGEKHKCNLCGRMCNSKLHLTHHRLTHFKRKLKKMFPCAACKKIHFVENIWDSCIIKHFRKDKQAGFICAICTSVFKRSMYLDHHVKISGHLNKRLYLCGICKKRYYKGEDLRKHKKYCSNRTFKIIETKLFKCKICSKGFGDKYNFHDHIEWHKNPDKFKCMDCGKRYCSQYQLRQHRKIHGDVKYYTCKVCKQKFQRNEFKIHSKTCRPIKIYSGLTSLKCIFCDKVLESEEELKIHLRSHKGKMPCKFCGKILKKKPLRIHLKLHSTEYEYKCDKCERAFNTKDKLERHRISAHTVERPFACTDCDAKFKSKGVLKIHVLKHSTESVCDICGKKFSGPYNLNRHKKLTHDKDLFKCTYETCGRKFYERALLTEHIKVVHTKEIHYLCEVCQKTFATKKNFKDHMRNHTGETLFPCTQCDKSFVTKTRLSRHIMINHSEKKLKCNICKKTFSLNEKLQQHIHCVHGEKKFQCEFCSYLCASRAQLTRHIKINHTHANDRPFVCEICGKSYKEKHHLTQHLRSHDKVKKTERELADTESESD